MTESTNNWEYAPSLEGTSHIQLKKRYELFIDGKWVKPSSNKYFDSINPANEEKLAEIAWASDSDVDLAVKAARKAYVEVWSVMKPSERAKYIFRIARLMQEHARELAVIETLDGGKPIRESRDIDVPLACNHFFYYAGWADKLQDAFPHRNIQSLGVAGQIIPWNFPLLMQAWKWAPALATGCTMVLKPAEQTPLSALAVAKLAHEAGIPNGVINVVPGYGPTAGAALTSHMDVDKIAFTGETTTGQLIMEGAARSNLKRVTLELGGKSPNIVFADSDIDAAVEGSWFGLFFNQGQCCCAGSRLYVEEKIHDQFVEKMLAKVKAQKMGDPFDQGITQGPQISAEQRDRIMGFIDSGKAEGAHLLSGGGRPQGPGYFIEPTVFTGVEDHMRIAKYEIFGPVMNILKFKDADEVIKRGNNNFFGLAAAVWTRDINKAIKVSNKLRAGTVWVNCYDVFDAAAPFGGFKMSGLGRELGEYALHNYTEVKTVYMAHGN